MALKKTAISGVKSYPSFSKFDQGFESQFSLAFRAFRTVSFPTSGGFVGWKSRQGTTIQVGVARHRIVQERRLPRLEVKSPPNKICQVSL